MTTKHIKIDASISNDGLNKNLTIDGYAYLESGFLTGLISSGSESERNLITAFSFTGCPIAAHTKKENINPWIWTDGAYIGKRLLRGEGFLAKSKLTSRPTPEGIDVKLDINIEGDMPNITGIAYPFQEKIVQKKPGLLQGNFDIVFLTDKGEMRCETETEYALDTDRNVPTVFRNITILTADQDQKLRQIEQIDLFDDKEEADKDLAARMAVS